MTKTIREQIDHYNSHWTCGDCGRDVPKSEDYCGRQLDDYLSLRGGSIEEAIKRAVDKNMQPVLDKYKPKVRPAYVLRFAIAA